MTFKGRFIAYAVNSAMFFDDFLFFLDDLQIFLDLFLKVRCDVRFFHVMTIHSISLVTLRDFVAFSLDVQFPFVTFL